MEDHQIVELYWQRDESAIQETEQKYGRYLSRIAYQILADTEDSMEVGDALPPEEEVDFILDRPFLFVITGDEEVPLFAGVVNQP